MKYKTLVMEDIGKLNIRETELPEPGDNEILVRIRNCNICTTDWQNWNGMRGHSNKSFPFAPGHEACGIVQKIGAEVDPSLVNVGDYIAVGYTGCGACDECRSGHNDYCRHRKKFRLEDVTGSFGMAEYKLMRFEEAFKMRPGLPYEEACYLEPVSTSVHGIRRLDVKPGDYCVVIGAGNLGLVNAQVAKAFGCQVAVSEVNEERLEIAKSLGFPTVNPMQEDVKEFAKKFSGGRGVDHVIVAVGNNPATEQAFQIVKFAGKVLLFAAGYPSPDLNLNVNQIHYGNWHIIGTGGSDTADFQLAAQFLNEGTVKVGKLISHVVPFAEYEKAFELAATPGNYRVSISIWPYGEE